MSDLPQAAIDAATAILHPWYTTDALARQVATEALDAAAPHIRAAERQHIREALDGLEILQAQGGQIIGTGFVPIDKLSRLLDES